MTDVPFVLSALDRGTVVRAAAEFADLHGIGALTLTRVAETLGVSLPSLHAHVRSHADCTAAVAQHGLDGLTDRLQQARGRAVGDGAVRAVADGWRAFAAERPGLYAAVHRHPWSRSAEQTAAGERLQALLCSVVLSYGGNASHAADAAWALGSALHGFVSTEVEGAFPVGHDLDLAFAELVRLLCDGLRLAAARP